MNDDKAHAHAAPIVIEVDAEPLPDTPSPMEAPPPEERAPVAVEQAITAAAAPRRWGIGRVLIGLGSAFVLLWLGVAVTDFVTGLFQRHTWLGWAGSALLTGLVAVLLVLIAREMAALARLGRIETVRMDAEDVHASGSTEAMQRTMEGLDRLYRSRPDLEWARERVTAAEADTPDPTARLSVAEREYMSDLDRRALEAVTTAARSVAAATALIPLALADVLAALYCNLRMVREISEIYGGRAGWIGSWRLMRAVAAHLVATGAVAATDDLLGPLVGGGVLGKISRRFGEGAVNGALTARIGISAIEVCRPLPFVELERPSASGIVLQALKAWRKTGNA